MKANDMLNKIKTIIGGIELTEEVKEYVDPKWI